MGLIYLDNAATTFPKPREVYDEVSHCLRSYCGNPGRGSHPLALAASQKIYECRTKIADFFGASDPANVIFTLNATYALNILIKGLLQPGDHVLISDVEHNAVWRPLERAAQDGQLSYDVFSSMLSTEDERRCRNATRICARIAAKLRPNTKAVLCTHQSNLCSATLPLKEIGAFCRRHGLLFLVDASQSAGHIPVDVHSMCIDALCAPGHKGMYGIQGCGFIVLGNDIVPDTLIEGGSGYHSLESTMPDELPERLEAGTLSTPSIAGLSAGVSYLTERGLDAVAEHEKRLFCGLRQRLLSLPGYHVYLPEFTGSTLMFHREGISSDRIGHYLAQRGICTRTGYHCAALGHRTLNTPEGGGIRVSFGIFNREQDVDALYRTLRYMEHTHEVK